MINHNISTKEELSNRINYYKSLLLSLTTKKEGIQDIIIEFINNTINKYDIYGFGNVLLDISSYLYKQNKLIELSGKLVLLSRKCLIQDSILRINIEDLYNEFIKLVYNIDSDIVNIRFV